MKAPNSSTKEERIKSYLQKSENPYCFFSNKTKVTICFCDTESTIEERLKQYILKARQS